MGRGTSIIRPTDQTQKGMCCQLQEDELEAHAEWFKAELLTQIISWQGKDMWPRMQSS